MLFILIGVGLYYRRLHREGWANWIHAAIFIHFLVGAFYSGIRMIQMDAFEHMLIRRIYACEAWFNFACAAFYFLVLWLKSNACQPSQPNREPDVRS